MSKKGQASQSISVGADELSNVLARETWLCGQELDCSAWTGPFDWTFSGLLPKIREKLRTNLDLKAFVFGTSEPQQFSFPSKKGEPEEIRVLPIPAIVVVFCGVDVPDQLGITSVQSSTEDIVQMRSLKMSWCPWNASEHLERSQRRAGDDASCTDLALDQRIFKLHCTIRHGGQGPFTSESRRKKYEYCMPYVLRSKDVASEPEEVTHVIATYKTRAGAELEFGFDKEVDRTQLFIPELIEDYGLEKDEFDPIKDSLKAAFQAKRAEVAKTLDSQQKALAALGGHALACIDAMFILKVYPDSEHIDPLMKTTFVNRYYGSADEVM
mmetsp:Transcript_49270/g.91651  ORF Transcript_49270/g.91651 Transcript_49270/m.91651 type:complete len:326 (-) Transcript_49270:150-1127(-)|eukprot:CAMPEP_0171821714 /NCGR_PEP_ID=MMETSP0992-20121227/3469_1 /TAXON_ID=483369 /ORGANISM="non described non described, Strain CCMP2098" /LENGTH=325 /DNA_ID=CAMNT_0012436233 /DNA_START=14 /DNA_END=991 /DNA_ORIENTATION=+